MDVKAVGAVLVYVVIVLTSTALTGGAGLHTGERRLKYGHFFAQTLYSCSARVVWLYLTHHTHTHTHTILTKILARHGPYPLLSY